MALDEYRRKRDFKKTPEPAPQPVRGRRGELAYLIQKHDATRLHYDFRLELDGVLLSWAVTKGPSLNPSDKRLAVRTEDHPLEYGKFEGTIPKGQYGGGTVMLWDRGTWEPKDDPHAGLKKGHLSFVLHGERLKGGWDLIRMHGDGKRENWLLIKENDGESRSANKNGDVLENFTSSVTTHRSMDQIAGADPTSKSVWNSNKGNAGRATAELRILVERYPEVQLATLVDDPPEGDAWVHEIKFDGYRLLGFVAQGQACLRTRNGKDWTASFPTLASALEELAVREAVLDMEAVVLDAEGKSSFQALQAALGEGGNRNKIVAFVFDLLHLDGKDLTSRPLTSRKEQLQEVLKVLPRHSALRYSGHIEGQGAEMFANACKTGLEGVISKLADSTYTPGRQRSWLKIKCAQRQEFIILGFSAARKGDRALGALYLGYKKNGALRYAGKVGTGFTMKSARELADRFRKLSIAKPTLTRDETKGVAGPEYNAIQWIKPALLCEVAFTEWTEDGRIRHPSFQGLREDKNASDVKQETPVPAKSASKPKAKARSKPAAGTAKHRAPAGTAHSRVAPAARTRESDPTPSHAKTRESAPKSGALVAAGITITHPDRVISETGHITKGDLAEYFAAAAPFMLPGIERRPLSLLRCPSGIDGDCFYQRNPGRGLGPDVHSFDFRHKGRKYEYLYIDNEKGLLELIQMGAIEIHPWGASIDSIDYPDRMIFDLDPAPDVPFEALKLGAQDLRQRLKKKGLDSTLKCTGGKGLHVTVALAAKDKWAEVKAFAASVAHEMVDAAPSAYVATMTKAKRTGKIFIDYFRNDYTATAIADYGVRARPGAPVALPLEWKELKELKSANQFTMKDVLERLKHKRPEAASRKHGQRLPSG